MANRTSINSKLDEILKNQKVILENEKKILGEEEKIEELEKEELSIEEKVSNDEKTTIKELEILEKELRRSVSSPIKKITKRDLVKGFIGAFIGLIGHFAFSKAFEISESLDFTRATILYLTGFLIIILMLYYTGFRNIEKHIILRFMPLRAVILYSVSIITVIVVYFLFGKVHLPIDFLELYKLVGAAIILAVIGAGTADLIGRNE